MSSPPDPSVRRRPFDRIVVPVDGSEQALAAIPTAIELARRTDVHITLLSVLDYGAVSTINDSELEALASTGPDSVPIEPLTRIAGDIGVESTIVDEAAGDDALIVMASHGHRTISEVLLGSVTEAVMRGNANPVLVVGPNVDPHRTDRAGPMVACLDGAESAEPIVPTSVAWASALGQQIQLVTVVEALGGESRSDPDAAGDGDAAWLSQLASGTPSVSNHSVLQGDDPAHVVADLAARDDVSFLVAATHGRSGWKRLTLGSVTMSLVREAPCPVLVVRSPSLDQ